MSSLSLPEERWNNAKVFPPQSSSGLLLSLNIRVPHEMREVELEKLSMVLGVIAPHLPPYFVQCCLDAFRF